MHPFSAESCRGVLRIKFNKYYCFSHLYQLHVLPGTQECFDDKTEQINEEGF